MKTTKLVLGLLIIITISACSSPPTDFSNIDLELPANSSPITKATDAENAFVEAIGAEVDYLSPAGTIPASFPQDIITRVESASGAKATQLYIEGFPKGGGPLTKIPKDGIAIRSIPEEQAVALFDELFVELQDRGYYPFLTNIHWPRDYKHTHCDFGIIAAKNQWELIKFINTDGANYDIPNSEIIQTLQNWETIESIKFQTYEVSYDKIVAKLTEPPQNSERMALLVSDLAPDTIWQGAGTGIELAKYIKDKQEFWLWWD